MTEQVPAYQIESWQDSQIFNEQGRAIPGKRVNVRMANGQRFYVEVPYLPGWSEAAQQAIEQQHGEHQAMAEHQGPMIQAPRQTIPLNPRTGP